MKNRIKQHGFGIAEIFFIAGVILMIAALIYFFVGKSATTQQPAPQTTTLPAGWETYTKKEYAFSIGHPSDYKQAESLYTLPTAAEASDRSVFGVQFKKTTDAKKAPVIADLNINVSHQTLDQATRYAKSNITTLSNEKQKLTITKEESLTISGHRALRIDAHVDLSDATDIDYDFTNIYVEANGLVYNIATQDAATKPFETTTAQAMYKSFAITNKK